MPFVYYARDNDNDHIGDTHVFYNYKSVMIVENVTQLKPHITCQCLRDREVSHEEINVTMSELYYR